MQLEMNKEVVVIPYEKIVETLTLSEQKQQFLEVIAAAKPIEIDTKDIRTISIESLQLLICFKQSAEKNELSIAWKDPSIEFINLITTLGFTDALGIAI